MVSNDVGRGSDGRDTSMLETFIESFNTIQYKHEYYYSGINPVEF